MAAARRRTTPSTVAIGLGAVLLSCPALAGDAQTAEALYQSAREALARGDLDRACPEFAESQRLDPAPGTLLNLAECEERSGKLASALAHVQEAHDELPPGDYRLPFSLDKIAKLKRRVPHLVLRVKGGPEPGTKVIRDGTELGSASLSVPLPVDPGKHVCVLRMPGHADARVEVSLDESETRTVDLVPGPAAALPGGATRRAGDVQRTWGLVAGGAGLAGLALGGILGLTSKIQYDDAVKNCANPPTGCPSGSVTGSQSAYTQAAVADAGFIAGGVLVATGLTLFFTAPRTHEVTVAPAVGARQAGFRVSGSF